MEGADDEEERRAALEAVLFVGGEELLEELDKAAGEKEKTSWTASAASLGLDMVPVVGEAKALWQLYTGKDMMTGEAVSRLESAVSLIPIARLVKGGKVVLACVRKGAKVGLAPTKQELVAVIRGMRPKPGWNEAQLEAFRNKQELLLRAAEKGELRPTVVTKAMKAEAEKAKREFRKQHKALHPEAAEEMRGMHVDHKRDMQVYEKGAADQTNLQFLDPSVNMSTGKQLQLGIA
jgi:hypothetical protein